MLSTVNTHAFSYGLGWRLSCAGTTKSYLHTSTSRNHRGFKRSLPFPFQFNMYSKYQTSAFSTDSGVTEERIITDEQHVPQASKNIKILSQDQMEKLGHVLGTDAMAGDVVLLTGNLGAGKTCFARGFIRSCVEDGALRVTSPSYLLDNTYETQHGALVHHIDLFRLSGAGDLHILNIPQIFTTSVCLIEWPDRLGSCMPQNRLEVEITASGETVREVHLKAFGQWWIEAIEMVEPELQKTEEEETPS